MSIGDDISNLLRKIGPDAGIYQDLSQYNASRGGGQRRGLLGRTQSAPPQTPAAEASAQAAPATTGVSSAPADNSNPVSVESSTPRQEFLEALAGEIEKPAPPLPVESLRPLSSAPETGESQRPISATPVAAVLQGNQGWQLPAPTLAAKTAATGKPTSLSSLARRLNSDTRSADELDLSALGDALSEAPIELAARPTQRLDRLFDRLASSMPR